MSFGDTFVKNQVGEFLGVVSHTVASISNTDKPTESEYIEINEDETLSSFIPLTARELEQELNQQSLPECERTRFTFWSFGGMVESERGSGKGYVWYEKGTAVGVQENMDCDVTLIIRGRAITSLASDLVLHEFFVIRILVSLRPFD